MSFLSVLSKNGAGHYTCVCKPEKKIQAKFWSRHVSSCAAYRAAHENERTRIQNEKAEQAAGRATVDTAHATQGPIEPTASEEMLFDQVCTSGIFAHSTL